MKKILVTGGAGYIGSHIVEELMYSGYIPVVVDSRDDIYAERMKKLVEYHEEDISVSMGVFIKHKFDGIIHLAGSIQVKESVDRPALYYRNNLANSLSLLEFAKAAGVPAFVFSSTAAVYGNASSGLIAEDAPLAPINTYGWTKMMFEQVLEDYWTAYRYPSVRLRYFNVAGASASGRFGENHGYPETHLIPSMFEAAVGLRENFKIFGTDYDTHDGTCIRDYVHVVDLAKAHIRALEHLMNGGATEVFNLGAGRGYTVREILNVVKQVTRKPFDVIEFERRAGDPSSLIADISKAQNVLGYQPTKSDIYAIVQSAWDWFSSERLTPDI